MIEEINCGECMFVKMCSHQHKEELGRCGGRMFRQLSIEKKIEIIRQYDGYKNEDEKESNMV